MNRTTLRLAGPIVAAGLLGLAVLAPAAALAAGPTPVAAASDVASDQPTVEPSASDGGIAVDPTFIIAPTPTPSGGVLGATGRPETPPPTDVAGSAASAGPESPSLVLLLLVVAIVTLAAARMPDVRRR